MNFEMCMQPNGFCVVNEPNGWPVEPRYKYLYEVQGATNVEAMSHCKICVIWGPMGDQQWGYEPMYKM